MTVDSWGSGNSAASSASGAVGQIPDLDRSTVTIATTTGGTLFVSPDGGGHPFAEGRDPSGAPVDLTVTITVIANPGGPVAAFPFEDIWLSSLDQNLVPCNYGLCPDGNTDLNGQTGWSDPPLAGGWSDAGCQVSINGDVLPCCPNLPLRFNSPDLNGDLRVDLTDAGLFSEDLHGGYTFRADLRHDGAVNLSDVGYMAAFLGSECP